MNPNEPHVEKSAPNSLGKKYAKWVGIAMILAASFYFVSTVIGLLMLFSMAQIVPQKINFQYLFIDSVYYIMMVLMMVGGILTLRKKRLGVVFSNAAIVFWLVSRFVIFIALFANGRSGLIPAMADILGLNIPPTFLSVSYALINAAVITSFIHMRKLEFKTEMGLNPADRIPGLGIGILLLLYGLVMWYLLLVQVLS